MSPTVAVVSFPGNNCEVESMRTLRENGITPLYFRWNDDRAKLRDVDGYFLPGGFAYEDRGRSGMVAGRDPLMDFIAREAEAGKTVIGNCNGAQVLVESGLIPLGKGLQMSLARNAIKTADGWRSPGFLSEWIWMTPACAADRCATSNWTGAMHLPIAHGEGRFTTEDKDLLAELEKNNQLAFRYCDASGTVSEDQPVTPNGAVHAVAGICNAAGNVVAIMPHPERTKNGDRYFQALKLWLEKPRKSYAHPVAAAAKPWTIADRSADGVELFIGTLIVNNEERTVEQAAQRSAPGLKLRQWKYLMLPESSVGKALSDLTVFNPRKERAYLRRKGALQRWNADAKREEPVTSGAFQAVLGSRLLLRRDVPDTGAGSFGPGSQTGVCYGCDGVDDAVMARRDLLEIFCNPHAGTLERIV